MTQLERARELGRLFFATGTTGSTPDMFIDLTEEEVEEGLLYVFWQDTGKPPLVHVYDPTGHEVDASDAVIYTDAPANGEADPLEPMDMVELEKRLATVLPGGWKLGQVHAEQPATTYAEFKREILNEIARCLNMPFNVAAGNSSGYNYASGRLDHQTYFKSIRVEQHHLQTIVLDRILRAWLDEAVLIEGLLPQSMRRIDSFAPHTWFWDGVEHVDPAKEATAQATRLSNHTTTLALEYARQGRDWEEELKQRAKEVALMKTPGLSPAQTQIAGSTERDEEDVDDRQGATARAA